ncbi:MAG: hypothetical protein MRERV_4c036 [Mycoplasmataceae bacterium RV_VA103A]|nr:MAG: hypothetical protein MRERV_4c036 [Mycoplasmataceae bacterium RV_VA103A]
MLKGAGVIEIYSLFRLRIAKKVENIKEKELAFIN